MEVKADDSGANVVSWAHHTSLFFLLDTKWKYMEVFYKYQFCVFIISDIVIQTYRKEILPPCFAFLVSNLNIWKCSKISIEVFSSFMILILPYNQRQRGNLRSGYTQSVYQEPGSKYLTRFWKVEEVQADLKYIVLMMYLVNLDYTYFSTNLDPPVPNWFQ